MKSKVVVLKTRPEKVFEDIGKGMALAGYAERVRKEVPVILKDNISWHVPFLSANTTPWQLEGVIRYLQKSGYRQVVSVHNRTVVTDPFKGEWLNRLDPIYKKFGVAEYYNFQKEFPWVRFGEKLDFLALPRIYGDDILIPEFFIGKNIIHLPTCKTHIYTTTTGSMKNAFGGLLNTKRHYTHSLIHETLVDLLMIQKKIHPSIFTVMDGTICGSGPGPRTMTPHEKNLMLFSDDPVAIDATAARIMGFDPMSIRFIRLATEKGLGNGEPANIDVLGEDISRMNFGFAVGDNLPSAVGDMLWFSPLKVFQRLLFHTPLVYLFVFASFFYHDYFWWPVKGKRIMRKFAATSQWAKYFETFPE